MAAQEVSPQVAASGRAVPPNQAPRTIPSTLAELLLLMVGVHVLHLALLEFGWGSLAFVAGAVSLFFIWQWKAEAQPRHSSRPPGPPWLAANPASPSVGDHSGQS